jgi:hypothetical protein
MEWTRRKSRKSWRNPVRTGMAARVPGLLWARQLLVDTCGSSMFPDPEPDSVFVITSYELIGKPLAAYRRRRKKKRQ